MSLCSGPYAGVPLHRTAGNATVYSARSHGSSGNSPHRRNQTGIDAQTSILGLLCRLRIGLWRARSFSHKVLWLVSFIAVCGSSTFTSRADEYSDVSLRSGLQLKSHLEEALKQYPDVRVALEFYSKDKFYPDAEAFTEFAFRSQKTKENYRLFFIPVTGGDPAIPSAGSKDNTKRFVLLANGPKTNKVFLATVSKPEKEPPVVTEEKQVIDKKVQEDAGLLKRVFKCSATGCAGAAGCVLSGPGWLPCLCLSCGAVVAACSVTELFFP